MTILSSDLQVWHWPSTLPNKCFQWHFYSLCQILKSMHKCRSYGPDKFNLWPFYHLTFKCDGDFKPTWTNVSNGTATSQGEHLCKSIWNQSSRKFSRLYRTFGLVNWQILPDRGQVYQTEKIYIIITQNQNFDNLSILFIVKQQYIVIYKFM